MSKRLTTQEFIERARKVHGNKYDYSKVVYINRESKVNIICPIHGMFEQVACYHLGGSGCSECAKLSTISKKHLSHKRKVHGIGINDLNHEDNVSYKISYRIWGAMMNRCYSNSYQKTKPTYIGCTVCDEWLYFSNFKKWFDENYIEGFQIDKDILIKGNKVYSPETCCFVPQEINTLLLKNKSKRGDYPIGITFKNGKYRARLKVNGKCKELGFFNSKEEAFGIYKQAKERYIKELAKEYFEQGKITEKVYNALLNYKIEITD